MDGSVKKAPEPVVDQILQAVAAEPERKEEIVQEAIESAKANNGYLQTPKKTVASAPELEDEEQDDPEAEEALEELTETITTLIHQARHDWNDGFVAQLKKNVLEAFKSPLREMPPIIPATVA